MIRRFFLLCLAVALPSVAFAQSGLGPISPRTSSGSGSTTITAGTTATSGCTDGGFLYSLTSLVQCGANAINTGSTVTIGGGISGTNKALIVNNATSTGNILELQDNGSAVFTVADGGQATGWMLSRSPTYASGSDVGLTVQGSLTGNIQEWKTAANTAVGAVTVAGAGLFADGSAAAPGMGFYGTPTTGIYRSSSGIVASILTNSYTTISSATYGGPVLGSSSWLVWSNNTSSVAGTPDLFLIRKASGVLNVGSSITNTTGLIGGGAAVASATAMPLPTGRVFHVTGTTNITSITSTNFASGAVITIIFDGVLTFTDGSNLKLAEDFVTTAGSTITLVYDGTNWYEIARSVN